MILCKVDGCSRKNKSRGMCQTHYQSWLRDSKKGGQWSSAEVDSFWSKVDKSDSCWVWTAGTGRGGYGIISINAYPVKAHRFSWLLHKGEIPNGLGVLHTCDNPRCVKPDHLFLGTTVDNVKDRDSKNRQCQGESHSDAKLSKEQVTEIRRVYVKGCRKNGVRPLARRYKVCRSSMRSIVTRKTWKGVE